MKTRPTRAAIVAVTTLTLANPSAHAATTVWNVNIGTQITTSDDFAGAAPENTVANSFWNSAPTSAGSMALADATGSSSAGVTLTLAGSLAGGTRAITGPEIFATFTKAPDNATPFPMTIGGLSTGVTYDLVVYSDWFWKGNATFPVTQTVGSGLIGTVTLDQISTGTNGTVPGLVEDTDLSANGAVEGNWIRITGLTPDSNGDLGLNISGTNAAFSGFQLVQIPEPSAALLGSFGLLALLRRRR